MALLIVPAMASWKRHLHLSHRWLGIAIGVLVLLWFGSGVVMVYVAYPALTEPERMAWLAPPDAGRVKVSAWDVMLVSPCALGAMLSTTGLVLGWRRLRKRGASRIECPIAPTQGR